MNLPFRQHVLICTGPRCGGERQSERIRQEFRRQFVRQAVPASVKDTACICFGLCSYGPNVIVYPDGVDDLVGGRVVERLLFRKREPTSPATGDPDPASLT
ncbi:MAG: hypothetical protein AUH92_05515 [Acidobacteria bacterium 13_1_40CM_4_69_4]|nr:MAG: hypothetical protein AUH92_05515 [Acidobacteria bacterium 13_1_40CM_4_69_4]